MASTARKNKVDAERTSGVERAALYIRVSSEEQAMHGLSLGAQRDTLTSYAEAHKLKIAGLYADEGITARKRYTRRTAFCRMLEDVRAGKIDVILFIKLDRWFRNIADYYEVQRVLDEYGVRWIATEEDYDTTTANGRLHLNIKLSIAQDESDRTSERIKFVFNNKVQRGEVISGKVPLGYKIQNKHLVIDPEAAKIVQDIFEKYIAIRSVRALREYIMNTYGIVYCYTNIKVMLKNEKYIGYAHGMDNFCPAIIDEEIFRQVQNIMDIRAQRCAMDRTDRVYLFTGLVFCAECGNRLSAHVVDKKYIYYRCTKYEKLHLCTHKKRTSELVLEKWLLDNLVDQLTHFNLSLAARAERQQPTVDTDKIKRKMTKLKDLYLNDLIEREVYEKDYRALQEELRTANAVIEPLPKPIDTKAISDGLASYNRLSRAGKKEFWSRTVKKVIITNDETFSICPI